MPQTTKLLETTLRITHNQEILSKELNNLKNVFSMLVFNFNQYMQSRNNLDQLNLSLQIILQFLTDLENATIFSRISTLHNSINREEEIEWIIDVMRKYHSEKQY